MSKSAQTYVTAPRIIRAVYVSEPGTYDIDGVPFEATVDDVGRYFSKSDAGGNWHILCHSSANFERVWQLPGQEI